MASNYFFKPVFYRLDNNSILFAYDDSLKLIRIPQFTVGKEIKTSKDLEREMKKISDITQECGIIEIDEFYAKSSIEVAEGLEKTFFFYVKVLPVTKMPQNYYWITYDEAIKENDEIAWWDIDEIIAFTPGPTLKN